MYEYNSELACARRRVAHSLLSGGMAEKVFIDANELFVDSYRLARKIFDDGYRPDYVVGVWRGGCPIGVAVEEFLRVQQCPIKHHTAIKTQSYYGIGKRREVEVFGLEYIVSKVNVCKPNSQARFVRLRAECNFAGSL